MRFNGIRLTYKYYKFMTITNSIAAKLIGAIVAVAMLLTLAGSVEAQQSASIVAQEVALEEQLAALRAQYNALLAQLANSGTAPSGVVPSSSSSVCPYQWNRDLNIGSSGPDVMKLQQFLNSKPVTRIAATGIGSAGQETEYYGSLTAAAVSKFQTDNSSRVLAPVNLVNPTGVFGPSTRREANSHCSAAPVPQQPVYNQSVYTTPPQQPPVNPQQPQPPVNPQQPQPPVNPQQPQPPVVTQPPRTGNLTGSAELDVYEIDDVDDDEVAEGATDVPIAEIDVEFAYGDALIHRLAISFTENSVGGEDDLYDIFEMVSLWVDGDKIAEMETDNRNDWRGSDDNELRFVGLNLTVREDEEMTITIAATLQDGIDPTGDGDTWTINLGDMRFEEATGYVSQEAPTGDNSTNFTIIGEGANDMLELGTSDDDPAVTTLKLKENDDTDHVIFAFELDAEDSDSDIEITEIELTFTVSSGTAETYIDASDSELRIGNSQLNVDGEDWDSAGNSLALSFEEGDFVVEVDERIDVEFMANFHELDAGNEGVTIQVSVNGNDIEAEGSADSVGNLSGTVTGETHTMRTSGLVIDSDYGVEEEFVLNEDETRGTFTFTFEVEAFEEDIYVDDRATQVTTSDMSHSLTRGVVVAVLKPDNSVLNNGVTTVTLVNVTGKSSGDVTVRDNDRYRINEDGIAVFEVEVAVDPTAAGGHRVVLLGVGYNLDEANGDTFQVAAPENEFRTGRYNIPNAS